jgi:hypothetical protein
VTYLGHQLEYTVTTAIGPLFATSASTARPFEPGTEVGVAFADRGIIVLRA